MVAEDNDESSKTEEPSERKISKAKEEGDIAISQEAKSFIMLLGMIFVVWLVLPLMFRLFYQLTIKFVETPETIPTDPKHIQLLLLQTTLGLFKILGIPFAIFMILGIFASIAQTGFIYAPKKLEPNWNKLNIFAALPNFINMKKIIESLKGILKISVIAYIAILVVKPYLDKVNLLVGIIVSTIKIIERKLPEPDGQPIPASAQLIGVKELIKRGRLGGVIVNTAERTDIITDSRCGRTAVTNNIVSHTERSGSIFVLKSLPGERRVDNGLESRFFASRSTALSHVANIN